MKKFTLLMLVLLVLAGGFLGFTIYQKYLKGLLPALGKPPEDIGKLINSTGMPLTLPEGFSISVFAEKLDDPRVLTFDPSGNLLVSSPSSGKILALPDKNNDGKSDEILTVAENLSNPHGLAWRCQDKCSLYIAETDKVAVYEYDQNSFKASNANKIIDLPGGGEHFTRTIIFMPPPDGDKMLISVGSSCNVCQEQDNLRAKILTADYDGSGLKTFASGLRNSVFMAANPADNRIWATEMGRDFLGDNLPPDEINIIEQGKNYGWPICYGKNIHDGVFDKNVYIRNPCMEPFETPSYIDIPAHSAPLGLAFFPKEGWPEEFRQNLLVAFHGSWNRSEPTGYKIVRYRPDSLGNYAAEDFISGWLTQKNQALGRPVDILIRSNGKIYVSDDKAGVIYLISYK